MLEGRAIARRLLVHAFTWAAASCVWSAGCAPGDGKDAGSGSGVDSASGSTSGADDNDDALDAQTAVPMALVDGSFIASVVGAAAVEVEGAVTRDAADGGELAFAASVFNAGAQASAELATIYRYVASVMDTTFGAGGAFRGKDVLLRKDGRPRLFTLAADGSGPRYARLSRAPGDPAYQLAIFQTTSDGSLVAFLTILLTPYPTPGGVAARVLLKQRYAAPATGAPMELAASYDTGIREITGTYGAVVPQPTAPSRTTVTMALDANDASYTISGAYTWQRPAPSVAGKVARHRLTQTGDVELFVLRGRRAAPASAAQKLAFVPAEDAASLVAGPGPGYFEQFSYVKPQLSFLRSIVRDVAEFSKCRTLGSEARVALAGKDVDTSALEGLPTDVCATNLETEDADVERLIDLACRNGVEVDLKLGICQRHYEAILLSNPQQFDSLEGKRRILEPGMTPASDSATLEAELAPLPSVDVAPLTAPPWTPETLPPSAVADAEALP